MLCQDIPERSRWRILMGSLFRAKNLKVLVIFKQLLNLDELLVREHNKLLFPCFFYDLWVNAHLVICRRLFGGEYGKR